VKESIARHLFHRSQSALALLTLIATTAIAVVAQTPSDADAVQRRLMRARALAAAHNLPAAAAELDNIRNTATDDSIKDIARIMLMSVYLEGADYARALALLEETYKGVSGGNESSIRAYFTLAGQSVKGAREHLDRYKALGLSVVDKDLPPEANADLDRLRALLERFEGCALRTTAKRLVFADGNPAARLMFVGEAPGADEDIQGEPFVGRAGVPLHHHPRGPEPRQAGGGAASCGC